MYTNVSCGGYIYSGTSLIQTPLGQKKVTSGTSLIQTPLGQKKVTLLVRCPDFRGCIVHKQVFGTAKCVLFIEVYIYTTGNGTAESSICPVYRGVYNGKINLCVLVM